MASTTLYTYEVLTQSDGRYLIQRNRIHHSGTWPILFAYSVGEAKNFLDEIREGIRNKNGHVIEKKVFSETIAVKGE